MSALHLKIVGSANRKNANLIVHDILTSIPLLLSDMIAVTIAWLVASSIEIVLLEPKNFLDLSALPVSLIVFPTAYFLMGTYPGVNVSATHELENVVKATSIASLGMIGFLLISDASDSVLVILLSCLFFVPLHILVPVCRYLSRKLGSKFHWWRQPTLIVGSDVEVMRIGNWLDDAPELGLRQIVPRELVQYTHAYPSQVIFAFRPDNFYDDLLWKFPRAAVLSTDDVFRATTAPERIAALTLIKQQNHLLNPAKQFLKRSIDLSVALGVVVLTVPLLLSVALLVKLTSRGPIFYGHQRCGQNGRRFKVWKFRTMHVDSDKVLAKHLQENEELRLEWEAEHKLRRDPRITSIGRLLRKTSIDELPQLWNIIIGDMSLVGPRPIVTDEIVKYADVFPLYEMVRPGITGLWQTSGRNNTSYDERLAYDRYYVRHWSVWLDFLILVRTFKTALLCEGAY